jgi:2'-5' RNA ligase
MRCFLAIELPKEVKEELLKLQKQLPDASMKLVEPENLHLTLKFFGEIDDSQVNKIKNALDRVKFEKFRASFGKVGVFPLPTFVRVVWIALEPIENVKELHKEIDSVLDKEGIKEDKSFESHITLTRVRFIQNKEEFSKKLQEININPIEFEVQKFALKKSELTRKGPIYETIKEYTLR